jgi:hypothetical protein
MIKSFHIPRLEIVNRNMEQDNKNYYVDYKKVLEKFNSENGGKWRYPSVKELNYFRTLNYLGIGGFTKSYYWTNEDHIIYSFSDGMEYVEERDLWEIPSGDNRIRMVKDIG